MKERSKSTRKRIDAPTPRELAAARDDLRNMVEQLKGLDQPLELGTSIVLQFLLEDILAGVDVRKRFGIGAKNGKPVKHEGHATWLAWHYWALRLSGEIDLVARKIVAKRWGISESWVYQMARKHRAESMRFLKNSDYGETIKEAEELAARMRRNELIDANRSESKGG